MEIRRLDPGDRVLDYRILERLGEGGFGEVFRAEHEVLGTIVAIKVPRDESGLMALRHEGVVQARLDHPGIVRTRELSISHDPPFAVMEFVDGDSLAGLLRREGPMHWTRAGRILLAAGRALHHAHQQGVIHGDVKPGNLLVEPGDRRVLLTDFGLGRVFEGPQGNLQISRSLELATSGAEVQGTIRYLAPEMLRGETADERTDVYSFGVLLFEILTGKLPEGREIPSDLVRGVPASLDRLFEQTFARRERRPRGLAGVIRELEQTLGVEPEAELPAPRRVLAPAPAPLPRGADAPIVDDFWRAPAPAPEVVAAIPVSTPTRPIRALPESAAAPELPTPVLEPHPRSFDTSPKGELAMACADPEFMAWRDRLAGHFRRGMTNTSGVATYDAQGFDLCVGVSREGEPQHRVYLLCVPVLNASIARAAVAEARRIFDLEKGIWEKEVTFWIVGETVEDAAQVEWTLKSFSMGWWRRRRVVLQDMSSEQIVASKLGCDPKGNHLKSAFFTLATAAFTKHPKRSAPLPVEVVAARPTRCSRWGVSLLLFMAIGLFGSLGALEVASRALHLEHQRLIQQQAQPAGAGAVSSGTNIYEIPPAPVTSKDKTVPKPGAQRAPETGTPSNASEPSSKGAVRRALDRAGQTLNRKAPQAGDF